MAGAATLNWPQGQTYSDYGAYAYQGALENQVGKLLKNFLLCSKTLSYIVLKCSVYFRFCFLVFTDLVTRFSSPGTGRS